VGARAGETDPPAGRDPVGIEALTGPALEAVATIWKREGRGLTARVGGASMTPTIAPGALVHLACGTVPEPGQVAAFVLAGRLVIHRVVARSAGGLFLTRGDASVLPDPPVAAAAVIGRVRLGGPDGRPVDPPPAPTSPGRALALALCRPLLDRSPRAARLAIGALWAARRWFVATPRATIHRVWSALGGRRGPARPVL